MNEIDQIVEDMRNSSLASVRLKLGQLRLEDLTAFKVFFTRTALHTKTQRAINPTPK